MRNTTNKRNWFVRHKILTGILAFIVLGIIISVANGGGAPNQNSISANVNSSTAASNSSSNTSTNSSTPKLNQPAADGKFQFTVTSFTCGVSQIEQPDDTMYVVTAGAPYCVMNLSVKNISNQAQTFDDGTQYIYNASNQQYSDDSEATIGANATSSDFMELPSVNPGVSITGTLVFDVPTNVTPTYAVLHDSELSNGVKVKL